MNVNSTGTAISKKILRLTHSTTCSLLPGLGFQIQAQRQRPFYTTLSSTTPSYFKITSNIGPKRDGRAALSAVSCCIVLADCIVLYHLPEKEIFVLYQLYQYCIVLYHEMNVIVLYQYCISTGSPSARSQQYQQSAIDRLFENDWIV